jgi:hypothetical protein
LQIVVPSKPLAPSNGVVVNCSASTVSGSGSGVSFSSLPASDIGVSCAVVFAPSPLSLVPHAIYEVAVPLVVTGTTDPLYLANPIANVGSPFKICEVPGCGTDLTGFSPGILPKGNTIPSGSYIGLPPDAAPLGPPPTCSGTGCTPPPYALCANLPGLIGSPVASVAAFYAIATGGETLLSAPTPAAFTTPSGGTPPVCPF